VLQYGKKGTKKIASVMGNKTPEQVRSHAQKYDQKLDIHLRSAEQQYQKSGGKLVACFKQVDGQLQTEQVTPQQILSAC